MESRTEFCDCPSPTWISGMVYVDLLDAEAVYEELKEHGRNGPRCQRCDRLYHPKISFDPYA